MNIAIDAGNSRIKYGVFDVDYLKEVIVHNDLELEDLKQIHEKYGFDRGIITGSRNIGQDMLMILKDQYNIRYLTENTLLPAKNLYRTPDTLGKDRLAGAIAAHYCFPFAHVMVVDLGTATTYNIINNKSEFLGGNISPGLAMRLELMHARTDKLPLAGFKGEISLYGMDTESALRNGALLGVVAEIEYYKREFCAIFNPNKIILTGGNALFISHYLKDSFVIKPDLVLEGLNKILLHNA
ncbi:MAG TPA: type III pantothenate kinase [Saprospiraceae bacterium]|nr:type III pantothenate kinase [Saprospiraceae bacterium]HQW55708.1 type III pantothenate kinase [Saprospiraceae bacterium]